MYTEENIQLFRSLFKGRDDVFAIRWEKGNKSGYMPAYAFDPYRYRAHQMKGGGFQDFHEKSYLPLTNEQVIKHFDGAHHIGLYPLLPDNSSWFIVADFDKGDWLVSAGKFVQVCIQQGISAYLVLKKGKYRHAKHLQYLTNLHEGSILKLCFVLSPFAFVFLLAGQQQYHIAMETLDTDEATYLWHFPKSIDALKHGIAHVDKQLERIRTDGRQSFLESNPENFSRVIHDYTDDRKGFVLWKDALEERLDEKG